MTVLAIGLLMLLPVLAGVYSIVGLSISPRCWRKYLPYYIFIVAIAAYSYNPVGEPDLVRYFAMLDRSSKMTLIQVNEYFQDGLLVKNFIFWFFAHIGDNHLLPAFTVGVVYSVASYITCDVAENYGVTKWIPYILLYQFMVLPFISITNNIRNILAFSLIILATYFDVVKKKHNIGVVALYLLPCFVHTSGFLLLGLRILSIVTKKIRFLVLCAGTLLPVVINWLYANIGVFEGGGVVARVVRGLIAKGYWYLHDTDTTEWARTVASSGTSQLTRFVMMMVMVIYIILIYYNSKKRHEKDSYFTFNTFIFLTCVMTLALNVVTTPQYWRFAAACNIMSASVLIPTLKDWKHGTAFVRIAQLLLPMCMIVLFALYIRSSSYNTNFGDLLVNLFLNNGYIIAFRFIKGLIMF